MIVQFLIQLMQCAPPNCAKPELKTKIVYTKVLLDSKSVQEQMM